MPRLPHGEDGFTLIELLVIVIIIGVLAAIALPAFLGQTRNASDARGQTDVSNAQRTLETYWAENDTYAATPAQLVAMEGSLGQALNLTITGTSHAYRLSADSRRGATFVLEKTPSGLARSCTPVNTGACLADGSW